MASREGEGGVAVRREAPPQQHSVPLQQIHDYTYSWHRRFLLHFVASCCLFFAPHCLFTYIAQIPISLYDQSFVGPSIAIRKRHHFVISLSPEIEMLHFILIFINDYFINTVSSWSLSASLILYNILNGAQ